MKGGVLSEMIHKRKKSIKTLFLPLLSILLILTELPAQPQIKSTISGRVTDAATGEPIFNVNIFLANTTIGTTTGMDGKYIIKNIPSGAYDLIVSHISYELETIPIRLIVPESLTYNSKLEPRVIKGEEISVKAPIPKEWQKNLKKFTKLFIGKSSNAKKCRILNPEVLNFNIDRKTKEFTAFTDSIIQVENRALGYNIFIILEHFIWNPRTSGFTCGIYPRFEILEPQQEEELEEWLKNRRRTYEGSFKHFLPSLTRGKCDEEKFELYYKYRLIKSWRPVQIIKYANLLTPDTLGLQRFHFDNYLEVWHKATKVSWLRLKKDHTLIDTLGNCYTPLAFHKWGAWGNERVADILPLDYEFKSQVSYAEVSSDIDKMIAIATDNMELENWREAATWFKRILKKNPDHLIANYGYAICKREVGESSFVESFVAWPSSQKHFEHVIKIDSTFKDVFYQYTILEYYRRDYYRAIELLHRHLSINKSDDPARIEIFRMYDRMLHNRSKNEAETWLESRNTLYDVYYLGELCRITDQFEKADSIFQKLLANADDFPVIPIYLSLVRLYVQKNQPEQAEQAYWQAVESVSDNLDAKLLLEDLMYTVNESEYDLLKSDLPLSNLQGILKEFWLHRDPMPAAPYNHRLIEHYRRLLYAEENFRYDRFRHKMYKETYQIDEETSALNILQFPKWYHENYKLNDLGLIYARFGEPDEKAFALTRDGDRTEFSKYIESVREGLPLNMSWIYYKKGEFPKLIFHFTVPENAPVGYWTLVPGFTQKEIIASIRHWDVNLHTMNFERYVRERAKDVELAFRTDRHTFPEKMKALEMYHDAANFRQSEDTDLLQISYAIPLVELIDDKSKGDSIEFEVGVAIFGERMVPVFKDLRDFSIKDTSDLHVFKDFFIDEFEFPLALSRHNIAIHARVPCVNKLMSWQYHYTLTDSARDRLSCSTLKLAFKISLTKDIESRYRNDLKIIPNPTKQFKKMEPLFAYFEIYNLSLDKEGMTNYTLNFVLKEKAQKRNVFERVIGLFGGKRGYKVSLENNMTGRTSTVADYISFDMSRLEAGEYELNLMVKDNISEEEASTVADFKLN